jgi:hypothetical protein
MVCTECENTIRTLGLLAETTTPRARGVEVAEMAVAVCYLLLLVASAAMITPVLRRKLSVLCVVTSPGYNTLVWCDVRRGRALP